MPPPGNEYAAEQLKTQGNTHFKNGDYELAESLYGQAIQKNSNNPLLFTNRANARLKLEKWEGAIDDCLRSIELMKENMKAFFYLAQAQLSIHHPNEALSSALMAYELCTRSAQQTSNAATISALVLRAKKAKWEIRERERIRRRGDLLADLEAHLELAFKKEQDDIQSRIESAQVGRVEGQEEKEERRREWEHKRNDLRTAFALSAPEMRVNPPCKTASDTLLMAHLQAAEA
jgi:STIP1 family protein 1